MPRALPAPRPLPAVGAGRLRVRASVVWSVALHAATFVALARVATPRTARPELEFTVQLASAAAMAAEAPPVDDPPDDPVPDDDLVVPEPPPTREAPPEEPVPEERVSDLTATDEAPSLDVPPEPSEAPATTAEPVGPRSSTIATRRPTPPAPLPPPVPVAPSPRPVAVAAAAPSAPASAVEGARADAGNRPPVYPAEARANRWSGVVTLRLSVAATGTVRDASVATSSGYDALDRAALEAAWTWRFTPARRDGAATDSTVLRRVRFVLDGV